MSRSIATITVLGIACLFWHNQKEYKDFQPKYYSEKTVDSVSSDFLRKNFENATCDEKLIAVHESGHFVAAVLKSKKIHGISVLPNGVFDGVTYVESSHNDTIIDAAGLAAELLLISKKKSAEALVNERGAFNIDRKKSDLYFIFSHDPKLAYVAIENTKVFLLRYKKHVLFCARYIHFYKRLDESECKVLIEKLSRL
jgi:hypothetical protein